MRSTNLLSTEKTNKMFECTLWAYVHMNRETAWKEQNPSMRNRQAHRDSTSIRRCLGWGEMGRDGYWVQISLKGDENIQKLIGDGCTTL